MSRLLKTGINQVTQSYEKHVAKVKAGQGWAQGIDIVKSPSLTDYITAHTAGMVIKTMTGQVNGRNDSEGMGYGNYVMIAHQNNYVTLYAHLASVSVTNGQMVEAGQIIGVMGNTGNSAGAHLHFEVRKYNSDPKTVAALHNLTSFSWQNPTPYINAELPQQTDQAIAMVYRVQVGAYANKAYAVTMANELKSKAYSVIIKFYEEMYHVQVGAYSHKSNADNMAKRLKAAGYNCFITTKDGFDVAF